MNAQRDDAGQETYRIIWSLGDQWEKITFPLRDDFVAQVLVAFTFLRGKM